MPSGCQLDNAGLGQISATMVKLHDIKNSFSVQDSRLYLLRKPIYGYICVKIPKFLLPWQPGSVKDKFQ